MQSGNQGSGQKQRVSRCDLEERRTWRWDLSKDGSSSARLKKHRSALGWVSIFSLAICVLRFGEARPRF